MNSELKRMRELTELLNKYAYFYYVLDQPVVADKQYDALYDELAALEKRTGTVLEDSPTKRIGGEPVKSFKPHTHINKLYSLDKCNSYDELRSWDVKLKKLSPEIKYTLEYKLDGLTLCLTYRDGLFVGASTRGNGAVGEDVTEQVRTIKSIPVRIEYKGLLEAQGEGIMRLSELEKYNRTAEVPLKNARNGVAGAIRNLDPKVTAARNLDVVFYNVNYIEDGGIASQEQAIAFLRQNWFKTERIFVCTDIEDAIKEIESVKRGDLDFLIDGMVIKADDYVLRERLGYTDKFPRWAIAYKFEAEETTTVLKDVVWQVGRTGKLTPLGLLEPVELCGATVKKATLNNYSDILRKGVKKGSSVFVRRSNDVIPEILGVAEDNEGQEIEKPLHCPACASGVEERGAHIFCPNKDGCPPQICARIEHFASKDCMDIEGLSEKTVFQLYDKLKVTSPCDLFEVTKEELSEIEGFKDKRIENFLSAMERCKSADLPHFINALGIPNIGKKTARDLAEVYGNVGNLMNARKEELTAIDEVGGIMADSIIDYFKENSAYVQKLFSLGINPVYKKGEAEGYFAGRKFVLTGTLSLPRSEAASLIEQRGGIVGSSVTKDTFAVIAGESAGSKLDKAIKLDVKVLSESEFKEKL